jgi:transcriptional regulator with XRE-family HTH domain
MADNDQELIDALAEQYLDYLAGASEHPPSLAGLTPAQRHQVNVSWELIRAAWRADDYTPSPLHQDQLALALGLIPDPERCLDGPNLARLRRRHGIKASGLTRHLTERGWDVSTNAVFEWEQSISTEIAPALLEAIADILRVPADQLITETQHHDAGTGQINEATATPRFAELVRRWAARTGLSLDAARSNLRRTMAVAPRRGGHLTAEQWLAAVEALIDHDMPPSSKEPRA